MAYKYIFGPIPSRRLGISLGVDLVPKKICTLDCVYCESGETTLKTIKRQEYIPTQEVLEELSDFLSQQPKLDYITFSGASEPTLHSGIGVIINFLKLKFPQYKVALITNGTLFYLKEVRQELKKIDLVMPSLDATTDAAFNSINRPHSLLHLPTIIEGLKQFRNEYSGQLWLEIFLVGTINNSKEELEHFRSILTELRPDKVQLNTLDRPGTEAWVEPLSQANMEGISQILGHSNIEIISKASPKKSQIIVPNKDIPSRIVEMVKRRPCTISDLKETFDIPSDVLQMHVNNLLESKTISIAKEDRGDFFVIKNPAAR
ncbi:MAG: radical SAM protein [Bacteriovoracaceae bacterium]|nr:radical SAM protein [Bacteriovoracaceae bacterium]